MHIIEHTFIIDICLDCTIWDTFIIALVKYSTQSLSLYMLLCMYIIIAKPHTVLLEIVYRAKTQNKEKFAEKVA